MGLDSKIIRPLLICPSGKSKLGDPSSTATSANSQSVLSKESLQSGQQSWLLDLTFPNHMRLPAAGAQRGQVLDVALAVAADLR
jgi:hypothetical protein